MILKGSKYYFSFLGSTLFSFKGRFIVASAIFVEVIGVFFRSFFTVPERISYYCGLKYVYEGFVFILIFSLTLIYIIIAHKSSFISSFITLLFITLLFIIS